VEVVMPKMGESIQEGTILRWVKNVGDKVERDEVLLEISTDKVDTEVPSPAEGVLSQVLYKEGDVVEVGKVIAILGGAAGSSQPMAASSQPVAVSSQPMAVSSQPAAASQPPAANGQPLATNGQPANGQPPTAIPSASPTSIPRMSGGRFYSPLVRSIASVEGLSVQELDAISGTGLEGRVTKADVLGYLGNRTGKPAPAQAPFQPSTQAAPATSQRPTASSQQPMAVYDAFPNIGIPVTDDIEVIPMDRVRQLIAEHMVRSKHTSPHVTSVAEADVTGIVKLREKVKDKFQQMEGFKLTYTPFFGLSVVEAIREFPRINVSVDGKNILQHKKVHLGMATALPDGNLIVPVLKNADVMNLTGMARVMNDLAQRARSKKLNPDDISGGTITITNVGSFGSLFGSPVINQPQTAIIGIGAIQKRPVVRELDGEDVIVIRSMVYMSITYDHRVIDGALATQALAALTRSLERMNEQTISV
jgi:2-oxoglutarate dehydrogenase E2 component (dihydrolipoamide succinyltransferase)